MVYQETFGTKICNSSKIIINKVIYESSSNFTIVTISPLIACIDARMPLFTHINNSVVSYNAVLIQYRSRHDVGDLDALPVK